MEEVRAQFPAAAPIPTSRAPACAAEFPKLGQLEVVWVILSGFWASQRN